MCAAAGGDDYAAGAASFGLMNLSGLECGPNIPSASRGPVEKATASVSKTIFGTVSKAFTEQRVCEVFTRSMKAGVLSHVDISLACGWGTGFTTLGFIYPGAAAAADEVGVFNAALTLYRRVEPSPLPGEWWVSSCGVADVTTARLSSLWQLFGVTRRVPSATQSSWFCELLGHAIRMSKLYASAGLSAYDTMSFQPAATALAVVELAAQDESLYGMLFESGVMDALEFGILNDFAHLGNSVATFASGAAVSLVSRSEGGKVLRREAVHAVLERVQKHFQPDSYLFTAPPKTVFVKLRPCRYHGHF